MENQGGQVHQEDIILEGIQHLPYALTFFALLDHDFKYYNVFYIFYIASL